ncbi:MAG: hypothetical protein ACD_5C00075G0007 [uncultured bacterium]|nr:MAG: hypothetical protein ACD_5C00075G0007 [uncultured bacterium]
MREITQTHLDTCLKILAKNKEYVREKFKDDYSNRIRKINEMDFCERLVKALFEDYTTIKKQRKLL